MADIDARLSALESSLQKSVAGQKFTVNYLEKLLNDFDSLNKTELKERIKDLRGELSEHEEEEK